MVRRNSPESVPEPGTAEVRWQEDAHLLDEASAAIEELDLIADHLSISEIEEIARTDDARLDPDELQVKNAWKEYQRARQNWMDEVLPRFSPFRSNARAFERRLGKYRSFTRRYNNRKFEEIRTPGDSPLEMYRNRDEQIEQTEDFVRGQTETNLAKLRTGVDRSIEDLDEGISTPVLNIVSRFRAYGKGLSPYHLRQGSDRQVEAIMLAYDGADQKYVLDTLETPDTKAMLERHAAILEGAWEETEGISDLDDLMHQLNLQKQGGEVISNAWEWIQNASLPAQIGFGVLGAVALWKTFGYFKEGLKLDERPMLKGALTLGGIGATILAANAFVKSQNDEREGIVEFGPDDMAIGDLDPKLQEVYGYIDALDMEEHGWPTRRSALYMSMTPMHELIRAYENGLGGEEMNFAGSGVDASVVNDIGADKKPAFNGFDIVVMAAYRNAMKAPGATPATGEDGKRAIGLQWLKSQGYAESTTLAMALYQFNENVDWQDVHERSVHAVNTGVVYMQRNPSAVEIVEAENAVGGVLEKDDADVIAIGTKNGKAVVLVNGYPYIYDGEGQDRDGNSTELLIDYYDNSRRFNPSSENPSRAERQEIIAHSKLNMQQRFAARYGRTPQFNNELNRWEVRNVQNNDYDGLLNVTPHTGVVAIDISRAVGAPSLVLEGYPSDKGVDSVAELTRDWERETLTDQLKSDYAGLFPGVIAVQEITERTDGVHVQVDYGTARQVGTLVFKSGTLDQSHRLTQEFLAAIKEDESVERLHQSMAYEAASAHRMEIEGEPIVENLEAAFVNSSRADSLTNEFISLLKGLSDRASKAWEGEVDLFESRGSNFDSTVGYTLDAYQSALQETAYQVIVKNPTDSPQDLQRKINFEFEQMDDDFLTEMERLHREIRDELEGNPYGGDTLVNQQDTYEAYTPQVEELAYQNGQFLDLRQLIRGDMETFDWTGFDSLLGAKEDQRHCLRLIDTFAWPLPVQTMLSAAQYSTLADKETKGTITKPEQEDLDIFREKMIYMKYLRGEFKNALGRAANKNRGLDERVLYSEVAEEMTTVYTWTEVMGGSVNYTSITNGSPFDSVRVTAGLTGSVERMDGDELRERQEKLAKLFDDVRLAFTSDDNPLNQVIDLHQERYADILQDGYYELKDDNGGNAPTVRDFDNKVFDPLFENADILTASLKDQGAWAGNREIGMNLNRLAKGYIQPLHVYRETPDQLWRETSPAKKSLYDVDKYSMTYTRDWQGCAEKVSQTVLTEYESSNWLHLNSEVLYADYMELFYEKANFGMYHNEYINSLKDWDPPVLSNATPDAYTIYFLDRMDTIIQGIATREGYTGTDYQDWLSNLNEGRYEEVMKIIKQATTANNVGEGKGILDYYHWAYINDFEEGNAPSGTLEEGEELNDLEELGYDGVIGAARAEILNIAEEMNGALWLGGAVRGVERLDNTFLDHANKRFEGIVATNRHLPLKQFKGVVTEYHMFLRTERDFVYAEAWKYGVFTENQGRMIVDEIITPAFDTPGTWDPLNTSSNPHARTLNYQRQLSGSMEAALDIELNEMEGLKEEAVEDLQSKMKLSAWYHDVVGSNTSDWQDVFDTSIEERVDGIYQDAQTAGLTILEFKNEMNELESFLYLEKHYVYGPLMESGKDADRQLIATYANEIRPFFEAEWGSIATLGTVPPSGAVPAFVRGPRDLNAYRLALTNQMEGKLDVNALEKQAHIEDFREWFEGDAAWSGMSEFAWHDSVEYFLRGSGEWNSRIFAESVTYRITILNSKISDPDDFKDALEKLKPYIEAEYHGIVSPALNGGLNADSEAQIKWQELLFGNANQVRWWEREVESQPGAPTQPKGAFWFYWDASMDPIHYERYVREHFEANINGYLPGYPGGI